MSRREPVRVALVARRCIDCGAEGFDVRVDLDGRARCFAGLRCRAALPLPSALGADVATLSAVERARLQRALNRARRSS